MQIQPLPLQAATDYPFQSGKYTGSIEVSILRDQGSSPAFVRVDGARIALESFQGRFASALREKLGAKVVPIRDEVHDLLEIFGDKTTMANYGSGKPWDEASVLRCIEKDAIRPFNGNLFSGYAIVHKETGKIIGRVSLGSGYEAGESQSGLLVHKDFRNQNYAQEAICLAASLALQFYNRGYAVGEGADVAPVTRFTATALNSNQESIDLITKLGMRYLRPLTAEENYSDEPRSLYGISGALVAHQLDKFIDIKKIKVL